MLAWAPLSHLDGNIWQAFENTNQQVKTKIPMVETEWKTPATEAKKMDKIIKGEHRPRRDEFLIKESKRLPSCEETEESPERKCG